MSKDRFKFRLYDKKIKEMIYADNKTQNNINIINYLIYSNNSFIDWDIENYALMQCTGLKDKNGKLIYEGDIVKQNNTIYSVNWFNGSFCFKDTLNGKNYTVEFVMSEKQEIIGNIHENKELIERTN